MKRRRFQVGIGAWIAALSLLLTRLWLSYPNVAPLPRSLAEYLVQLYGAQNAEQVADLEILIGLAITLPTVSFLTFLMILIFRRR
ncbi:hypothetical protein HGO34_14005 [Agrobacterium vitis]|uniref:Uncharacterized protein n=1 Tax=Agrobacterium vitis TaxID=373 RepID=A0AAE4WE63_AGRVI|nr:hypothetical protein [Agrobacterium vitis]MCF1499762.1 hypothetical protein [Allorhizobium sp. Av2]MCM2440830.1 hypothetical protein [Agrobacterium vitis]MUZ59191.1 hypothetical protein [Agrobacterium vitis]MVA66840.1 hypothetical protein [Agrobacterium vitis]MVA87283.1 hypothetical protein [Agrobacterium vitis]